MDCNFKNELGTVDGDNGRWMGLMIASSSDIETSVFFSVMEVAVNCFLYIWTLN